MELMYPIVIVICFMIAMVICFKNFNKKKKYTNGKKVANTKYVKESEYYRTKVKKYKILSNTIKALSVICILTASILTARVVKVQTKNSDKNNRDILLGIDISGSQDEVNLVLVKKFREIMPSIKGDRVGIVIFNTAPVVLCPLTDDYEYVMEYLTEIEKELTILKEKGYTSIFYEENGEEKPMIIFNGVSANVDQKGSSLIGDGLAGTIFSFPDLKTNTERTRIIVFATDNDLGGKPTISLEEACNLCKKYEINLYAHCPTMDMNQHVTESKIASYKKAVEQNAKGKFYLGDIEKMASNIVNEIKKTKTSLLKTSKKTYVTDYPEALVIIITITFVALIIIEKRVKL